MQQPAIGEVLVAARREFATADACRYTTFSVPADDSAVPPGLAAMQLSGAELSASVLRINAVLRDAETLGAEAVLDGCLGCLTLFAWTAFRPSAYANAMRRLEQVIASENETVYRHKRLQLLNPLSNGLLEIEVRLMP
eukprot:TRINITY_DN2521_c0_g1_i4.p4 TRINITY_DN2521_c0_g1~~TRINITY_DN2521_c0_g1_i4.p4  ORF type:complete len:138 (+),score=54.33 TRINITY_DN2521_c0_g1_i4:1059-1472(+)